MAQKLCQHSDKAGGWFGVTAQKPSQGGVAVCDVGEFWAQKPCQHSDKAGGWFGVTAQKLCQDEGFCGALGAKAMPTSYVGKSWQ
ncbi:MAG: hypothetical protein RR769_01625 [Anaerovoracaceae bacterium]